MDSRYRYL